MRCPKCKEEMKTNVANKEYVCLNSKCKYVISWGGDKQQENET
jgi:hypothetical protein